MPLFKSKDKKHGTHHDAAPTARDDNNARRDMGAGTGNVNPRDYNADPAYGAGNATGQNAGYGAQGGIQRQQQQQQPGFNNHNGLGSANQSADPYSQTAPYNDPSVPPAHAINSGNGQHSGSGSRMAGKMEHAVGTLVGSQNLKNKGLEKEQEAQAYKQQGAELAEAENLEREALLRRERAVQHGAHPRNKALGGGGQQGQQGQQFGNNFDNGMGTGPTGPQGYGGSQAL